MAFRFRRSVRLAPGVRWNIGKRSTSLTFGPRGAKVTIGTSGTRATVGAPGSGMSYSVTTPNTASIGSSRTEIGQLPPSPAPPTLSVGNDWPPSRVLLIIAGLASAASGVYLLSNNNSATGLALLCAGGIGALVVSSFPEWWNPQGFAAAKAQIEFTRAFSGAREAFSVDRARDLRRLQRDLGLPDHAIAPAALELLEAFEDLGVYQDDARAGASFPVVDAPANVIAPDSCFFAEAGSFRRVGEFEPGHVFITDARIVFVGPSLQEVKWSEVVSINSDGRTTTLLRRGQQQPYVFGFRNLAHGLRVAFLARNLTKGAVLGSNLA